MIGGGELVSSGSSCCCCFMGLLTTLMCVATGGMGVHYGFVFCCNEDGSDNTDADKESLKQKLASEEAKKSDLLRELNEARDKQKKAEDDLQPTKDDLEKANDELKKLRNAESDLKDKKKKAESNTITLLKVP
jgi:septal ring factor EnvC (AmiA/AmiB activator)